MYAMLGDPPPPHTHTNNYHSVILQFSDFTPFFLKLFHYCRLRLLLSLLSNKNALIRRLM